MTVLSTTETVPKLIAIVLILRQDKERNYKFSFGTVYFHVLKES